MKLVNWTDSDSLRWHGLEEISEFFSEPGGTTFDMTLKSGRTIRNCNYDGDHKEGWLLIWLDNSNVLGEYRIEDIESIVSY